MGGDMYVSPPSLLLFPSPKCQITLSWWGSPIGVTSISWSHHHCVVSTSFSDWNFQFDWSTWPRLITCPLIYVIFPTLLSLCSTFTGPTPVIVMTFWYIFWNGLNFFELFKLYFHLGLITTPHVHMTYVYSLFLCFIFHTITWPREVIIILWSFWLWSSILRMHPHPHFLLPFPLHPHPYTHHQDPCNMGWSEGVHATVPTYGEEEDPRYMLEDCVWPKLRPAKVGLVLPSNPSVRQVGRYYQEPLPD